MNPKNNLIIGLVIAAVIAMSYNMDANPVEFVEGMPNLAIVLKELTEVESELFGMAPQCVSQSRRLVLYHIPALWFYHQQQIWDPLFGS